MCLCAALVKDFGSNLSAGNTAGIKQLTSLCSTLKMANVRRLASCLDQNVSEHSLLARLNGPHGDLVPKPYKVRNAVPAGSVDGQLHVSKRHAADLEPHIIQSHAEPSCSLSCVQGLGVLPAQLPATVFEQHHIKESWAALELGGPHLATRLDELVGHLNQLNSPAARARVDADILLNTQLTSDVSLITNPTGTVRLSGRCTPRFPFNMGHFQHD